MTTTTARQSPASQAPPAPAGVRYLETELFSIRFARPTRGLDESTSGTQTYRVGDLLGRLDPRHPSSLPIADLGLRVIVICQDGLTSSLAAEVLLGLGVHRSTDVIGGFTAWRSAGLPHRVQG